MMWSCTNWATRCRRKKIPDILPYKVERHCVLDTRIYYRKCAGKGWFNGSIFIEIHNNIEHHGCVGKNNILSINQPLIVIMFTFLGMIRDLLNDTFKWFYYKQNLTIEEEQNSNMVYKGKCNHLESNIFDPSIFDILMYCIDNSKYNCLLSFINDRLGNSVWSIHLHL